LLCRSDVVHAYNIALSRRSTLRHRAHQIRLDAITPEMVDVIEVSVQPGSPCDGRQVKDVAWPRDSMIATLRRGRQVSIPRGTTVIRAGDLLVVVAEAAVQEEIKLLCNQ
jgi:Trk K+ transport system NAD-binding subunit